MYARTFSLAYPFGQGLDCPATGPGLGQGRMNTTEVCAFLSTNSSVTREFDVYAQVPFAYRNFDWISYESEASVAVKARFVAKGHFGGIMTFALNYDDWPGKCRMDRKRFPLQKAISRTLELASMSSYQKWGHVIDVAAPVGP